MRPPGHRVRQPAVPLICCPRLRRPRLILTPRTSASENFLTGIDHWQAPFRSPGQRNRAAPGGRKPGASREPHPALLRRANHSRAGELCAAASTTSGAPPSCRRPTTTGAPAGGCLPPTGVIELDGACYLRDVQPAELLLCRLVAHHSCAVIEAEERSAHQGRVRTRQGLTA